MKWNYRRTSIISFIFLIGIGVFFSIIHTGQLYSDYRTNWDYRRLRPDIIPPVETMQIIATGHDTSYAMFMWIQLIQFIGDNIRDARYLQFTHEILTRIHHLHPRFAKAYEIDLLFMQSISSRDTDETITHKKNQLKESLEYYESTIHKVCDTKKIWQIDSMPFWIELWDREDIKNPCLSGYIPYYIGSKYDIELWDKIMAARYYKIASMHEDAPQISRYLGIIAFSSMGNYRDAAMTLSLMASESYDNTPYTCHDLARSIVYDITQDRAYSLEWIRYISEKEWWLQIPTDTTNPQVIGESTCYHHLQRGIKQLYLWFITQISADYPDITSSKELVDYNIIPFIPTIQSQKGFGLIKKNGIWKYTQ